MKWTILLLLSSLAAAQINTGSGGSTSPSSSSSAVPAYGFDAHLAFGAAGNSNGTTGSGTDDAPAILNCIKAASRFSGTCNLPMLVSGGTTHYRWATPQILDGSADVSWKLTCTGSDNDQFNGNTTGDVSIDVDMGGQTAGPALWLGDVNHEVHNGPTIDGSCHFRDISTSRNSPGAIGVMNISNAKFYAGMDRFALAPIAGPTIPAAPLACVNSGGNIPTAQNISIEFSSYGPGGGNSTVGNEINTTTTALGCTVGSCSCTPVQPTVLPATAIAVGVYLGTATGTELLTGLPFVASAGTLDPTHNFNFFLAPTSATAITCIPNSGETGCTGANGFGPDKFNHTSGYGYYEQGSKNFYCQAPNGPTHGDGCANNAFSNQNHFGGGQSFDGNYTAIDRDSGTAWDDMVSIHTNLNTTGQHHAQQETNGIYDDWHAEGGLAGVGPGFNLAGTAVMHNTFIETGNATVTAINGVSLVRSLIDAACGGSIAVCFTDDANSGQNILKFSNTSGTVAWQPNSDQVWTTRAGASTKILTAQKVYGATTPESAFSGFSWNIEPSMQYDLSCKGITQAVATGGLKLTLTGPASPSKVVYDYEDPVSIASGNTTYNAQIQNTGTTYPTDVGVAVTTAATDMPFTFNAQILNGANAGQLVLKMVSAAAVNTTVQAGFRCVLNY